MFFGSRRAQQVEVQAYLRRICDLTSPNLPRYDDSRGDTRQNRTLAVLLAAWECGRPQPKSAVIALTRDISDHGLSVILSEPMQIEELAVGFWLPHSEDRPRFFLGSTRHTQYLGGRFWALGIEVLRKLESGETAALSDLAMTMLPAGDSVCH